MKRYSVEVKKVIYYWDFSVVAEDEDRARELAEDYIDFRDPQQGSEYEFEVGSFDADDDDHGDVEYIETCTGQVIRADEI